MVFSLIYWFTETKAICIKLECNSQRLMSYENADSVGFSGFDLSYFLLKCKCKYIPLALSKGKCSLHNREGWGELGLFFLPL